MKKDKTDKQLLVKGLQKMGISLVLMFIGPSIIYLALSNKEKPLYLLLLILGIFGCGAAIYFAFKGLNTIMDSLFNKNSTN